MDFSWLRLGDISIQLKIIATKALFPLVKTKVSLVARSLKTADQLLYDQKRVQIAAGCLLFAIKGRGQLVSGHMDATSRADLNRIKQLCKSLRQRPVRWWRGHP